MQKNKIPPQTPTTTLANDPTKANDLATVNNAPLDYSQDNNTEQAVFDDNKDDNQENDIEQAVLDSPQDISCQEGEKRAQQIQCE